MYTHLMPILGAVEKIKQVGIPEGLKCATRNAQKLLSVVKERVGSSLSKASEKLPGTIQSISGAIQGAAGGAKSAVMSRWEWVKRQVEERRK